MAPSYDVSYEALNSRNSRTLQGDISRSSSFSTRTDDDQGGDTGSSLCFAKYTQDVFLGRTFALPDCDYNAESWLGTLLAWHGSVIPQVLPRVFFWMIYSYVVYVLQLQYPETLVLKTDAGPKVFSAMAIFFTIFRLSSAHVRYRDGVVVYETCTDSLRAIVRNIISNMDKKGNPAKELEEAESTNQHKLDMLRFTLVTGILIKLQGRLAHVDEYLSRSRARLIELDMSRLRGLLYVREFEQLKKVAGWRGWTKASDPFWFLSCSWESEDIFSRTAKRQFPLYNWGLQHLSRAIALACVHKKATTHGFAERMLNVFEGNIAKLEACGTSMLNAAIIPVPLAYIQIARLLLLTLLLVFPFQLNCDEGLFANTFFPVVVSLVFNCMDQICSNMEDPHGDDPSDLKLVTPLQDIELEMMTQLEETSDPVYHKFVWKSLPPGDEWLMPRGVESYLCLLSEAVEAETLEAQVRADCWAE